MLEKLESDLCKVTAVIIDSNTFWKLEMKYNYF